jgi:hypothetical protein
MRSVVNMDKSGHSFADWERVVQTEQFRPAAAQANHIVLQTKIPRCEQVQLLKTARPFLRMSLPFILILAKQKFGDTWRTRCRAAGFSAIDKQCLTLVLRFSSRQKPKKVSAGQAFSVYTAEKPSRIKWPHPWLNWIESGCFELTDRELGEQ